MAGKRRPERLCEPPFRDLRSHEVEAQQPHTLPGQHGADGMGFIRETQPLLRRMIDAGLAPAALLRRSLWGRDLLLYRRVELGPYAASRKSLSQYLRGGIRKAANVEQTMGLWRTPK